MRKTIAIFTVLFVLLTLNVTTKAAIIYTNITDATLSSSASIDINFDGAGGAEFTIGNMGSGSTVEPGIMFNTANDHFTTVSAAEWDVIKGYPLNTSINSSTGWFDAGDAYINPFWGTTLFPTGVDTYIGAQFKIGANTYFGWIRVNLNSNGAFIVKDYAYNNTPNTAILAGDVGTPSILVTSITVIGQGAVSTITTAGGTLQMQATVLPANATTNSVSWSVVNGTGSATISTTGLLKATGNGTVTVKATANDGSNVSGTKLITISNQGVGLSEITNINISIYPNPTKDFIIIENSLDEKLNSAFIYNITGELVFKQPVNNNRETIDIRNLSNGIYFIKFETTIGKSSVYKIIKE